MPGAGLSDLGRPRDRYDLSQRADFGSLRSRQRRDRKLARRIKEAAEQASSGAGQDHLAALAHHLQYAERAEEAPISRASYVGQGYVRLLVGSDVYRLADRAQRQGVPITFGTLAFRGGAIRPHQLVGVDPRRWGRQLRADLDRIRKRQGLTGPGWSTWFLDCDYLQVEGMFLFHWHGLATGSELEAYRALRKLRKYRSCKQGPDDQRDAVKQRARGSRKPLYDIGYLCLYMLKEEWPSQPAARNVAGNRKRSFPRPLPEHLRPAERLFFDQWPIQAISVMRGLRVVNGRLQPTR